MWRSEGNFWSSRLRPGLGITWVCCRKVTVIDGHSGVLRPCCIHLVLGHQFSVSIHTLHCFEEPIGVSGSVQQKLAGNGEEVAAVGPVCRGRCSKKSFSLG